MKANQAHKDPRITNISFDNFTGSISIVAPFSDDEESEDLMFSSAQTNTSADLFKSNHHVGLVSQPLLGARSRKKEKTDSTNNSRRSSYNDSPPFIVSPNRVEKFHYDKRMNHLESSDSGLDYSLSTNSSLQYAQQQQTSTHRPLSALNEDSNTDDGFSDQPIRRPAVNFGYYRSLENLTQEKLMKKSIDDSRRDSLAEMHHQTNPNRMDFLHPSVPHRSFNDLTDSTQTILSQQKKRSRKKAKLNILIEPPASSISTSHIHDEQLQSIHRITKQTRAHLYQSILDRQHPTYLPIPPRKSVIPSDVTANLPFRQTKAPTNIPHPNPIAHEGNSTISNFHVKPSRQINPTEKRRSIEMNKWQDKELFKINRNRPDHLGNFLTSTPRRPQEYRQSIVPNFNQRQQPMNPTRPSKPTGFLVQNKTRKMNPSAEIHPSNFCNESGNKLFRTARILPLNTNPSHRLSNINRLFSTRSPIISDRQYSSTPENEMIDTNDTDRLDLPNEQQLLDGRHVIPAINLEVPTMVDSASQSSSRDTHPFTSTIDPNVDHSPHQLIALHNRENSTDHRRCSSSSPDRFPLPLGKVTIAMEDNHLSTHDDNDDGWSDDSAELLYIDERYLTQKKKN